MTSNNITYHIPDSEHAELVLHNDAVPTYTMTSETDSLSGVGGNLVNILNLLGKKGWVLVAKLDTSRYIMRREFHND